MNEILCQCGVRRRFTGRDGKILCDNCGTVSTVRDLVLTYIEGPNVRLAGGPDLELVENAAPPMRIAGAGTADGATPDGFPRRQAASCERT